MKCQAQSIKIDALYKPVLRRFRSTFRKEFEAKHSVKRFQHWTISDFTLHIAGFMAEELAVPVDLLNEQNVLKMLIILFPCVHKKHPNKTIKRSTMY